ncbi:MAG: DNA repair protein RadC [Lentisphaerae bacterium]|nr:DNA repair protein RadC [Lentisphaerota bacterium]
MKTVREAMVYPGAGRVRDMPERLRPREALERVGVSHVTDDVLLAVILRSGVRGCSVIDLARRLLRTYGSLTALAGAPVNELAALKGMGRVKAQVLTASLELGRRMNEEKAPNRPPIRTPEDAAAVLRDRVHGLDREVFWVLMLDSKNRLKGRPVAVSQGLLDASLVHPREVFREAIRSAVSAVVLAHNHPSGDCQPSAEDIRITRQLVQAGRIVDIKVLDHVILGTDRGAGTDPFLSVREAGLVEF